MRVGGEEGGEGREGEGREGGRDQEGRGRGEGQKGSGTESIILLHNVVHTSSITNTYLTKCGKGCLVTAETVGHPVLRSVLLAPQTKVTAQAAEVIQMPVALLRMCVLTTENELRENSER